MSHGMPQTESAPRPALSGNSGVAFLEAALLGVNALIVRLASIALIAASLILSYSVFARYIFHAATYWQDEASVFLLVGATFLSAAFVQSQRGHVAIEALSGLLPAGVNRVRLILVDLASFGFCTFFAWKSWTLFHEAWEDGQVSASTWAPPLWIPYSVMAAGMTLLALQILLQIASAMTKGSRA